MPQPFNEAVMTDAGSELMASALAGECNIEFSYIKIGDGTYSEEEKEVEELKKRMDLKSPRNAFPISEKICESTKSVRLKALITNQDSVTKEILVTGGYYINEIGLFAKKKGEDDSLSILYSIAVTSGDRGDYLPEYNGENPAQIIQYFHATVDNSMKTSVTGAGAALLAEDANVITDDVTAKRYKIGTENGHFYIEEETVNE